MKINKFLAVGGILAHLVVIGVGANYLQEHTNQLKICQPIGQVTEISKVSSNQYPIDIELIAKNGDTLKIKEKNAEGNIQSIHSTYYEVPITVKVNNQIKELRMKTLKVGDNLEQCPHTTKIIK